MLSVFSEPERDQWEQLCSRPALNQENLQELVGQIFKEVSLRGDEALAEYAKLFDGVSSTNFRIENDVLDSLADRCPKELQQAILRAKSNIEKFHQAQLNKELKVEVEPGISCWQKTVPISSAAIYVPGGSAPLFSTVLMLALPAKIAGVKEINLFTPPNKNGEIHPAIAFAAKISGVTNVFGLGGAQAIAAAALGTKQIPKSLKIFGPGNQYVTAAKMLAQQYGTAIDMPAGPSEVLVWADKNANAAFVAADLLSQAEHGPDSQTVVVAENAELVNEINDCLTSQLEALPRKEIAVKALENSRAVLLADIQDQTDFVNEYAAEHLIIQRDDANSVIDKIENAGSVFVGGYSPESVGDYASGTNHTLPTAGFARAYSGVNMDAFTKKITFQELSKSGLENLADTVITMAENEGLQAHANAVKIRLQ